MGMHLCSRGVGPPGGTDADTHRTTTEDSARGQANAGEAAHQGATTEARAGGSRAAAPRAAAPREPGPALALRPAALGGHARRPAPPGRRGARGRGVTALRTAERDGWVWVMV